MYILFCNHDVIYYMAMAQTTITPHNQQALVSRTYPSTSDLDGVIRKAAVAQTTWSKVPLQERISIGHKFIVSILRVEFLHLGFLDVLLAE
jgi:acyl-CoA reductase-like NAD-dependent aldehyde dehydrogenase